MATVHLPRTLMDMLQRAACCRVAQRWALLYRVVWRWQHGEQAVLTAADADGRRLRAMVRAVQRAEHDMHAGIRFRERAEAAGAPRFVAWYEPAHDVLAPVAQHYVRHMGRISWMIATPDASVLWDGTTLHNTGPLMRSSADFDGDADADADADEAPWLAYYRTTFHAATLDPYVPNPLILDANSVNPANPNPNPNPNPTMASARGAARIRNAPPAHGVVVETAAPATLGQRHAITIPIVPDQTPALRAAPSPLAQCRRCALWQYATQAVGGAGPPRARLMLVGEQPGDQEDRAGTPFVGPAGQLLERALGEAGIARRAVYLTNAVKHFKWAPRGKRRLHKTPAQREVDACGHWLALELAQVQPEVIVALGGTALKALLGAGAVTLKEFLCKPIRHDGRWVVAVYHPAYVLRVPDDDAKAQALAVMVHGLQMAQRLLAESGAR